MKTSRLTARLLTAAFLIISSAGAQTAVWTGQGNLATFGDDWVIAGNWDTGVVPNGATATAVINQATPAVRNYPDGPYTNASWLPVASVLGGALPVVTGAVTLSQLRFDLPVTDSSNTAAVYVGNPGSGTTGSLRLTGAGLNVHTASFLTVDVNVTAGSSLILANQARINRAGAASVLHLYLSDSTATAANPARLLLRDDAAFDASAPMWTTVSSRGVASLVFQDRARAGYTFFQLASFNTVEFHNSASAESATFNLGVNNLLLFDGDSTAATSVINFGAYYAVPNNSSIVRFAGRSTAAQSQITSSSAVLNTAVEFTDQATGGSASIAARRLDISGAATTTGTTGRLRATSSTLAPTSVVADDSRTVAVGAVQLQDLLLGSNTLQVSSGSIGNIRDSGGAYLSADGGNLVGGGLIKTGPGFLTLYGPSYNPADPTHPSYNVVTGPTLVQQGTLSLYNRLADVTVETGATLTGSNGIVAGRLTNRGTVTAGGLPLQVTGDFVQTAAGTFQAQSVTLYGTQPSFLTLVVSGNASLAGRLTTNASPALFPNFAPGVVTAPVFTAGTITGRFDQLDTSSSSSARVKLEAQYAPTSVSLRMELLPLSALGTTNGGRALGTYLDRSFNYNGSQFAQNYNQIVYNLTYVPRAEDVAQTLSTLAPDRYGTVLNHGFSSALERQATLDRLVAPGSDGPRGAAFAEAGWRRQTYDAVTGLPQAQERTTTRLAGGRWTTGHWTVGAYVADETADLDLDAGGRAKVASTEPGALVRFSTGDYFIVASAALSRDRYELRRQVELSRFSSTVTDTHSATPRGQRTDWSLTAGRTWRGGNWSLTPFAGYAESRLRVDDFAETVDLTGLQDQILVEDWARESRRARAGLRVEASLAHGRLLPHFTAGWWHEFSEDRSIPARFPGAASGYLAPGRPADLNTGLLTGGFDLRLGPRGFVSVDARCQRGDYSRTSSDFTAGFRWDF